MAELPKEETLIARLFCYLLRKGGKEVSIEVLNEGREGG